jgi:hypothetical protein
LELDAIEQTESMQILGSCVPLPFAAFSDGGFMQLSIVPPHHFDEVPCGI